MTTPHYFTPPTYAKALGVNTNKVLSYIASGELEAIDVSSKPGIGRPRWRISAEAVARFECRRSSFTKQATQRTPPRRQRQRQTVHYI